MRRSILVYGVVAYVCFLAFFAYFTGFLAGAVVPKTVDSGPGASAGLGAALAVDVALIALFGVQHSVMARASFKERWTRVVPVAAERSTFVFASTIALAILCALWQPLPSPLWSADGVAAYALWAGYGAGLALVLASSFSIDHFELFGLRQVYLHVSGRTETQPPEFRTPVLYRFVRHPMYLGFLLVFWVTPHMSVGHALLAAGLTGYILIGVHYEEADLQRVFGDTYREYQRRVPMLLPTGRRAPGRDGT